MSGEITYNLLWALFKLNTFTYITCPGIKKLRCIKYDFSKERTISNRVVYFYIKGRYIDFNGKVFSEVPINIGILKFCGSKLINSLNVFPL